MTAFIAALTAGDLDTAAGLCHEDLVFETWRRAQSSRGVMPSSPVLEGSSPLVREGRVGSAVPDRVR